MYSHLSENRVPVQQMCKDLPVLEKTGDGQTALQSLSSASNLFK